jgi:hypothetical protein
MKCDICPCADFKMVPEIMLGESPVVLKPSRALIGHIQFSTQMASPDGTPGGDFIFNLETEEFMRIKHDGTVIVRGETVASNVEVYKAFAFWVARATSPFFG